MRPTVVVFMILSSLVNLQSQDLLKVSRTSDKMIIDGKATEDAWKNTELRTFGHFYRQEKPTDRQNTSFRMLWDEENLYVLFECEDQYITARETQRDGEPYFDDCAEIFLIPAPEALDVHLGYFVLRPEGGVNPAATIGRPGFLLSHRRSGSARPRESVPSPFLPVPPGTAATCLRGTSQTEETSK